MMTNAPVGPPIWTRDPLNAATMPPPIIAVKSPCSGFTPDAMANAIESGNATVMTVRPAIKSCRKRSLLYPAYGARNLSHIEVTLFIAKENLHRLKSWVGFATPAPRTEPGALSKRPEHDRVQKKLRSVT